jgi:hypothetical protein
MKLEDKVALVLASFIPWLLVFVMKFVFIQTPGGFSPFWQSVNFVGPVWLFLSPVMFLFFIHVAVTTKN